MIKLHKLESHKCECKEKFHEMKEKTCDETAKKANDFIMNKAKKFRVGY